MKLANAIWYLARYDLIVLILGGGIFKLYWINDRGEVKASGLLSEDHTMLEISHGKEVPDIFYGHAAGELLFSFKRVISMPMTIGNNVNRVLRKAILKLSNMAV